MQNNFNRALNESVERAFLNRTQLHKLPVITLNETKPSYSGENVFSNRIINSLPLEESAWFLSVAKKIDVATGESIYRHGDNVNYIYFPETAVFSQYQVLEDGRTCEIAMIGKEGVLGLPTSASMEATCWTEISIPGSVYKISREVFNRNCRSSNMLQAKMIEYTNHYVGQLSQKIICNYFHQVKERFCTWLLTLQDHCQQKRFSFTQEAVARLLGVHRPSLSCIAKDLQQSQLIAYTRGQIQIIDREKLEKQSCVCYRNSMKDFA